MDTLLNSRIEELRMLKGFFEDCEQSERDMETAGHFGVGYSVFFGNAIQHNSFDIPYSAMRLIYRANKKQIDYLLSQYDK